MQAFRAYRDLRSKSRRDTYKPHRPGPNSAGKTTFALRFLKTLGGCKRFINADLIAAGLSPLAPERELAHASRLFLKEIEHAISARDDFAFETTLSGRSYLKLINRMQLSG
jgi:predicted ABC-type ATPase